MSASSSHTLRRRQQLLSEGHERKDDARERERTAGCTPDNHAANTLVYPSEPSSLDESLRRLESGFDSVDGKEKQVNGSPCRTPGLFSGLVRAHVSVFEKIGGAYEK